MKIIFLTISLCLIHCVLQAQDTSIHKVTSDSSTSVRVKPQFPGGSDAWLHFIVMNIHADVAYQHGAPTGSYIVTASYLIDTTGKISNVTILKDPGYGTGQDVLKLLKHSPRWIPATLNGKKVIYRQEQDIAYEVLNQ